jgi:hypothetical protein
MALALESCERLNILAFVRLSGTPKDARADDWLYLDTPGLKFSLDALLDLAGRGGLKVSIALEHIEWPFSGFRLRWRCLRC